MQLKNNLLYDPTGRAVLIFQNGASNISTCAEGSDCNLTTRESPFVSAKPFDFLSFSLRGGSPALDAGELVPATDIRFTGATQPPPDARSLHLGPFQSRGLAPSEAPLPARQASGP